MKEKIFEIPKCKKSGIYMIYNLHKHKAYIGQTHNFYQRATMHRQQLNAGIHPNNELQNDFNNGCEFVFAILELISKRTDARYLLLKEKQYIFAFREKYIKTYNKETDDQIKNNLFYDMVLPEITKIHKSIHTKFGCELAHFPYCKPETIIEKCIEKGMA